MDAEKCAFEDVAMFGVSVGCGRSAVCTVGEKYVWSKRRRYCTMPVQSSEWLGEVVYAACQLVPCVTVHAQLVHPDPARSGAFAAIKIRGSLTKK